MDVTHYTPFKPLIYIYVTIDRFSGFLCAQLTMEKKQNIQAHL